MYDNLSDRARGGEGGTTFATVMWKFSTCCYILRFVAVPTNNYMASSRRICCVLSTQLRYGVLEGAQHWIDTNSQASERASRGIFAGLLSQINAAPQSQTTTQQTSRIDIM